MQVTARNPAGLAQFKIVGTPRVRQLLTLGVVILAAWSASRHVSSGDLVRVVTGLPAYVPALAIALVMMQLTLQATRLHCFLRGGTGVKFHQTLWAFVFGQCMNNAFPARAGDVAKVMALKKYSGPHMNLTSLVGGVFLADKVVDIGAFIFLLAFFAPSALREMVPGAGASDTWALPAALLVCLALVFGALALMQLFPSLGERIRSGAVTLFRVVSFKSLLCAFPIGLAAWLLEATALLLLVRSLGYGLALNQGVMALGVLNLGVAVPITIANVGPYEASLAFGLNSGGVTLTDAAVVALLHHGAQLSALAVMTCIAWAVKRKIGDNTE